MRLLRLASELGVAGDMEMTGHLAADELERALAGAWVQAAPSFAEQFGLSAVEAAMRGTATVASRVGGLPEVVRDGRTGFLFTAGDHEALAARLVALLRDRGRAERMGREARADALARFSMSACAERFERLYERVRAARN